MTGWGVSQDTAHGAEGDQQLNTTWPHGLNGAVFVLPKDPEGKWSITRRRALLESPGPMKGLGEVRKRL